MKSFLSPYKNGNTALTVLFCFFCCIHLRDGSVGPGSNTFVGNCSMQMCIYVGWLTHAVNTTEFISLKPWAWHSQRCDLTHKTFTNIVSEMIISPQRLSSADPLTLLAAVFPPVPPAGDPPSLLQTYWIFFTGKSHRYWITFASWFEMVAVPETWFVLWIELSCWGHRCHLGNAGTSELLLVLQGCEVTSVQMLGSWFPGDQSWSILI